MFRELNGKVDNMQEQKGNVSTEMEILRKNPEEIPEKRKYCQKNECH